MKNRDSLRGSGITDTFAEKFKSSKFYTEIYCKHEDEVIIGIRDGYICLYYNCDCISKIIENGNTILGTINNYYIGKNNNCTDSCVSNISEDEIVSLYPLIKERSDNRNKYEKQAQQKLFMHNNNNSESNWFCIDVEYTKSLKGNDKAEDWRFDIIAISKSKPYKIALIELKYGCGAIGGKSGIRTHIKDFYSFHKNDGTNKFGFTELKKEIVSIVKALKKVGVSIPKEIEGLTENDISMAPEFYFITLDNNSQSVNGSTPKQTMSGYLFDDKRWNCKRISTLVKREGDFYKLTENDTTFSPVFLFSKETLPNIRITDIIEDNLYETEHI